MRWVSNILMVMFTFGASFAQGGVGHVDMSVPRDFVNEKNSGELSDVETDTEMVLLVQNRLVEMFGEDGLHIPFVINPVTREVKFFVKATQAWQNLSLSPIDR